MTSSTPRRRRAPRRVVRAVGEPGTSVPIPVTDDEPGPGRRAQSQRVIDPIVPNRAADDTGIGWHESDDSNDERLRRDVPPHWG
ncbi:MAG: hypothetical protein GX593_14240 [Actinomycetales bacterium]|nr:hypothetical protein [Actinomycetales bacterium]